MSRRKTLTEATAAASRINGRKGGRPRGSGTGRQPGLKRHLTAEGDAFLADVRDLAGGARPGASLSIRLSPGDGQRGSRGPLVVQQD